MSPARKLAVCPHCHRHLTVEVVVEATATATAPIYWDEVGWVFDPSHMAFQERPHWDPQEARVRCVHCKGAIVGRIDSDNFVDLYPDYHTVID